MPWKAVPADKLLHGKPDTDSHRQMTWTEELMKCEQVSDNNWVYKRNLLNIQVILVHKRHLTERML